MDGPSAVAYDAILEGKTGLMSALVEGRYDLVPIPGVELAPRKLDVATTYDTERYRPIYANKRGAPDFLEPRVVGAIRCKGGIDLFGCRSTTRSGHEAG